MKKKEEQKRRPFFTVFNLVTGILCFAAFLVIGIAGYYMSTGVFVSARLAGIYAVLALIGGAAMLLRLYRFALFYYIGCGLGWGVSWFISGLNGEFAPTAGSICAIFCIAVFGLFGLIAQWKAIQKRRARRKEEKARAEAEAEEARLQAEREAEEARKQAELDAARKEGENAEAALSASAEPPAEEEKTPAPAGTGEKKL